jgi:ABC-type dipeptide/oligopeptide/nickel transport system permease subunit
MHISIRVSDTDRAPAGAPHPRSRPEALAHWVRRDRPAAAAAVFLVLVALLALVGPAVTRSTYDREDLDALFQPPSAAHWLGTDQFGRDLLTRVLYGARISLSVGGAAVVGESLVGLAWGTVAGFYGGAVDQALMRIVDLLIGFPTILLAILVTGIFGPSLANIVFALVLTAWPATARTIRSEVVSIRQREYVDGARAAGASVPRILWRHVVPNVAHLLIVRATLDVSFLVLAEATLSFIGIGVQPPRPSWGQMIYESFQYLRSHPALLVIPAAALSLTVISFNLVGEALGALLDPRYRRGGA